MLEPRRSLPGRATLQDTVSKAKQPKGLSSQPALSPLRSGPNSDMGILVFLTTNDECSEGTFHFKYGKLFIITDKKEKPPIFQ